MKCFLFGVLIFVIILVIAGCSLFDDENDKGRLVIILQFANSPEVALPGKGSALASQIENDPIDRVHCQVIRYSSTVWEDDLDLVGSLFQASVTLDAGGGYEIYVECYIDNYLSYDGHNDNIDIRGGETNQVLMLIYPTVPLAPSNLQANAISGTQIDLEWDDNSHNESGFSLERKTGAGGTYGEIALLSEDDTDCQDTGLTPNTEYYYRVRAFNNQNEYSGYSNVESESTPQVTTIPDAPSNLQATAVSSSQIDLDWTDNSDNEDGFVIERREGNTGSFSSVDTVTTGTESYPNAGLNPNTAYFYKIYAYNTMGNSGYSNTASANTGQTVPAAPTNLQATVMSAFSINLQWTQNSDNEIGFVIERRIGTSGNFTPIDTVGINVQNYQNTGLNPNTNYYYRVCAYNNEGNSDFSNMVNDTTFNYWQRTYGGIGIEWGTSVLQVSDGGFVIAGFTGSYGSGDDDVYFFKTDINGNLQWSKTYGGNDGDWGDCVKQTVDGGYIIVGTTLSYGIGGDFYLIKTDAGGNQTWYKNFGGNSWDQARSIQNTSDGGYIILGYTGSFGNGSDVYLVKTDMNGNMQWYKTFGGSSVDEGFNVQQTNDGGFIIVGITSSYGAGNLDVYLIKTDSSGNLQWDKALGGSGDDWGYDVKQLTDGGYIIVGCTDSYGAGYGDIYLVKTDAGGNQQWYQTFGQNGTDDGKIIKQTLDGGYIIVGGIDLYGVEDVYLVKTDALGNLQWSKTFGGSDSDWGHDIIQTIDGGYVISGYTSSYGAGGSDVYLIKTDENGNSPIPPE